MKRCIIILLFSIVIHNSYVHSQEKQYPPDIEKIISRGKVIVGLYYKDMPPFFWKNREGKMEGIDIEIAQDIAKNLDVELEINRDALTYSELFEKVANGEVDLVISKFSRTFERAKRIIYSRPYVNLKQTLLLNKIEAVKRNIEKYPINYLKTAKFKIGVKGKTSYVEYAKQLFKNAEVIEYVEWNDVVNAIVKGEIIAALYDDNEILKLLEKNPDIALYVTAYLLKDKKDPLAIGIHRDSIYLEKWINLFLDTYEIDYSMSDLITKYPQMYTDEK